MFISSYSNSIDAKGRISIPAAFRTALQGMDRVVLWGSFENRCLEGGGIALLESYRTSLRQMPPHDKTRRAIMHAIFGRAREYALDSTGRIVLDRDQAEFAGIGDKALLVGLDDRFQIWEPEAYTAIESDYLQLACERSGDLGARSVQAVE